MLTLRKLFDWNWGISGATFPVFLDDKTSTVYVGAEIRKICAFRSDLAETHPEAVICELSTIEVFPLDRVIYVYGNYISIDYRAGDKQQIASVLCDTLKYIRDWISKEIDQ